MALLSRRLVSWMSIAWYGLIFASLLMLNINLSNVFLLLIPLTFLLSTRGPGCGSIPSSCRSRCHSSPSPAAAFSSLPPCSARCATLAITRQRRFVLLCVRAMSASSRGARMRALCCSWGMCSRAVLAAALVSLTCVRACGSGRALSGAAGACASRWARAS